MKNAAPLRLCVSALKILILITVLHWASLPMYAQESRPITDDDVNRLANRLYCPVCPNETLDACRTEACAQWRAEIRTQLEAGATEQQVIDNFIARFGQRVVGSPQDPALRTLAVGAPILIALAAALIGIVTFLRWQRRKPAPLSTTPSAGNTSRTDDNYRAMIERDLQ